MPPWEPYHDGLLAWTSSPLPPIDETSVDIALDAHMPILLREPQRVFPELAPKAASARKKRNDHTQLQETDDVFDSALVSLTKKRAASFGHTLLKPKKQMRKPMVQSDEDMSRSDKTSSSGENESGDDAIESSRGRGAGRGRGRGRRHVGVGGRARGRGAGTPGNGRPGSSGDPTPIREDPPAFVFAIPEGENVPTCLLSLFRYT